MAFPVISGRKSTTFASAVTSMAVNLPVSIASGNLLIAGSCLRNAGTWSLPSGWNEIASQSSGGVGELTIFYKIADGTEGATATWTAGTSSTAVWEVHKVTGFNSSSAPEVTTSSSGGTPGSQPNSPSLTPSWGSAETLWLTVGASSAEEIASGSVPTNYTDLGGSFLQATGSSVAIKMGSRKLSATSEDPGAFTFSASPRWWTAATIGIRPSGTSPFVGTKYALPAFKWSS